MARDERIALYTIHDFGRIELMFSNGSRQISVSQVADLLDALTLAICKWFLL